jgi:hypothetical protein
MNKRNIPGKLAIGCVLVASVAMFIELGCEDKQVTKNSNFSNNLKFVKCQQDNGGGLVTIHVESDKEVLKRDDRIYFVCPGETVVWQGDGGVKTFTVSFKNGEWPFPGSPTPLSPVSNNTTTNEMVQKLSGTEFEHAYAYCISVVTTSGANNSIDPHVIPIGN